VLCRDYAKIKQKNEARAIVQYYPCFCHGIMDMNRFYFLAVFCSVIAVAGCAGSRPDNLPAGQTRFNLCQIGHTILALVEDGSRLKDLRSLELALDEAKNKGILRA
jgi:hypothetical protein